MVKRSGVHDCACCQKSQRVSERPTFGKMGNNHFLNLKLLVKANTIRHAMCQRLDSLGMALVSHDEGASNVGEAHSLVAGGHHSSRHSFGYGGILCGAMVLRPLRLSLNRQTVTVFGKRIQIRDTNDIASVTSEASDICASGNVVCVPEYAKTTVKKGTSDQSAFAGRRPTSRYLVIAASYNYDPAPSDTRGSS